MAEIRLRGYVGMLALLVVSWAAGWLLGGPGSGNRRAMTLTTSLRNVGVGLVIVTSSFGGTAAVTAVLAYGIFEIVGSLLLALAWGRAKLRSIQLDAKPIIDKSSPKDNGQQIIAQGTPNSRGHVQ